MKRFLLATLFASLLAPAVALETDFAATYMTHYVFRGERLVDNTIVAPTIALKTNNIELSACSIYDNKKSEVFRNVYQLTFKTQIDKVAVDTGFVRYDPRKGANATNEFFAKASWKGNWQPSFAVFFDVKEGSGQYAQVGFARNISSGKNNVTLGTTLGYVMNNSYMGLNKNNKEFSGFYDGEIYLKSSFKAGKYLTIEPVIAYTLPLSNEGKDAIKSISVNKETCNLYGGITIHASF